MALKRFTEAKTAFQSVITALDDAGLGDGKQLHWQKEVQKMLALFDKSKYTDAGGSGAASAVARSYC